MSEGTRQSFMLWIKENLCPENHEIWKFMDTITLLHFLYYFPLILLAHSTHLFHFSWRFLFLFLCISLTRLHCLHFITVFMKMSHSAFAVFTPCFSELNRILFLLINGIKYFFDHSYYISTFYIIIQTFQSI